MPWSVTRTVRTPSSASGSSTIAWIVFRHSSTRLNVQITTSVGAGRRGARTFHRTACTVICDVSVLSSSHMPPPSTNRSTGPTRRTCCRTAPWTSCAATMRDTLLVSDAISRIRPVPETTASTSTSAYARPALPVGGGEAAEVGVRGDGAVRLEHHPLPLAEGGAALDRRVQVFGHQRRGPEEEPALHGDTHWRRGVVARKVGHPGRLLIDRGPLCGLDDVGAVR